MMGAHDLVSWGTGHACTCTITGCNVKCYTEDGISFTTLIAITFSGLVNSTFHHRVEKKKEMTDVSPSPITTVEDAGNRFVFPFYKAVHLN